MVTKTETKKETGETNLLSDWDLPKQKSCPDPRTDIERLDIDNLYIEWDSPREEKVEVTDSLILLPTSKEEKPTMEETMEELTETDYSQLQEEKYALHQKVYVTVVHSTAPATLRN